MNVVQCVLNLKLSTGRTKECTNFPGNGDRVVICCHAPSFSNATTEREIRCHHPEEIVKDFEISTPDLTVIHNFGSHLRHIKINDARKS